ncbi:hypothetical protein XHC_0929 [Xanthomonas hortorum pv. carotae str. M081]|nr:hypothetical protein XHC_0929 [Xanthomonas hortorum pv. carotae str. M081]
MARSDSLQQLPASAAPSERARTDAFELRVFLIQELLAQWNNPPGGRMCMPA